MLASDSPIRVDLLCSNELMCVLIDDYGEDIPVRPYGEDHFLTTIQVYGQGQNTFPSKMCG